MDAVLDRITNAMAGDAKAAAGVLARATADGVTDPSSAALVREEEWVGYGVSKIKARVLVGALHDLTRTLDQGGSDLLPAVPEDSLLLDALRVGGVAKVDETDVVAAVRVSVAERLGVFAVEDRLLDAIEERAQSLDEPCPQLFYDLQRSRSRKAHADVLAALGVPGHFVTDRRKRELLARTGRLWDALLAFQGKLVAWQEAWQAKVGNPSALLAGIAAIVGGQGAASSVPPSMMDAPDAEPLLDAARAVVDVVNKVFAGPGIPVARALAADAVELRALVERADLPAAIGATSREEMLRRMGFGLSADLVRAERSAVQYVLAVLRLPGQGDERVAMRLVAIAELGRNLPWDRLRDVGAKGGPRSV